MVIRVVNVVNIVVSSMVSVVNIVVSSMVSVVNVGQCLTFMAIRVVC